MGPVRHILTLISALLIALISAAATPALPIPAFSVEVAGAKALSTCLVQAVRNDTQAGAPNKGNFEAAGEILGELQADIYLTLAVPGSMAAKYGAKLQKLATNRGVPSNWTQLNPAGAQINRPTGFTTYRTPDGDMVHVSPSGLQYGADPKFGNRVDHVLDHTAPNPNKPTHTVFNAQGDDALSLVDEAWTRRGTPDPNDPLAFVVDLGRPIGTAGETRIRIVTMTPGGNEIRTAYPWP